MTPIKDAYLIAADSALNLIKNDAVTSAWAQSSALEGFTVGGLAAHLANQVLAVPASLEKQIPAEEPVGLMGHYERVTWMNTGNDADINVTIRGISESVAEIGPADLAKQMAETIAALREILPTVDESKAVHPPAGPWPLLVDDFLTTRMMEITVHSDDLAYSAGVETPSLPSQVLDPVLALLTTLAVRRHGEVALIRALTRAERAPTAINAF